MKITQFLRGRPALLPALLFALILFGVTHPALAATGTAAGTFTRAVSFTDGTPLVAADVVNYEIDCVFTPTGGVSAPCVSSPATTPTTSFTVTLTYPASGGRACFRTKTRTTNGALSDFSPYLANGASCRDFGPLAANPASGVTVTVIVNVTVSP